MSSLRELFHIYERPDPITSQPRTAPSPSQSSTRTPIQSTGQLFDSLPDFPSPSDTTLTFSWTLPSCWTTHGAKLRGTSLSVGFSTGFIAMLQDLTANYTIRNEVVDLVHQLFTPVNLVASRAYNKLKPEAYPVHDLRCCVMQRNHSGLERPDLLDWIPCAVLGRRCEDLALNATRMRAIS